MKKANIHYAWVILGTGVIGIMGALGLARFGYTVILPAMKESLGFTYGQMGLLGTGNLLGYTCFAVVGGYLASRHGARIVAVLSLSLMTITLFLTGMAGGFYDTLAARIITGIGSAGANVPIMGMALTWFSIRRRGLAAGILVAGSGLGVLITGSLLPGIIKAHGADGWRWAWYYLAGLSLVITVIAHCLLKNSPAEKNLLPWGTEKAAVALTEIQEERSKTAAAPLDWSKVYKNPALWQLGLVYFAFGFAHMTYVTFFSAHAMKAGNLSAVEAGRIWSLVGFVSMASGLIWGGISDMIGRRAALCIVFSLHALSFATFAFSTGPLGFYASALAFGISAWSIPSIVAAFAGDIVGARLAPAALGAVTVILSLGQALAPFVAGRLADASGNFFSSLMLASLVALGGAVGSPFLNKSERTA